MGIIVYSPTVAKQQLGKHVPVVTRFVGDVVFYAIRVVSKESGRLILPINSCCSVIYILQHSVPSHASFSRFTISSVCKGTIATK
jgi:hypothetical protein